MLDAYCGLANNANSNNESESELADRIGAIVLETPSIESDMERLITGDNCRDGMIAYIKAYRDGILQKLAGEINDGGSYIDQVKQKFNADAANWVWSIETVDERIDEVILEYQIVAESNKSLPKCSSFRESMSEWKKRANNIRIPLRLLAKCVGDLKTFLEELFYVAQGGQLQKSDKQKFLEQLIIHREDFDRFYKDQLPYFKLAVAELIDDLDEQDAREFFKTVPTGQFLRSDAEYEQFIGRALDDYKQTLKRNQLKTLWQKKTGSRDPADWSEQHHTPILCMIDDSARKDARDTFRTILAHAAPDTEIAKAIEYLETADFFDRLNDPAEIDRRFMKNVVGKFDVLLKDANAVRNFLRDHISDRVYDWIDNAAVRNCIENMASKQYKINGKARVQARIDRMDANELRRYLNELISDNMTVGMEILRNE